MPNGRNVAGSIAIPGRVIGPDTARPSAEEMAALALELWKARGCPGGSPPANWFPAEARRKPTGARNGVVAA